MTWRKEDPQGNESGKVRFELVPYMRGTVLDLGCGPNKIYPVAIGVDNRKDNSLFGIPFRPDVTVDTCERMPIFADQCADTVYSSHLLEHLENYRGALLEWFRLVKPGGHLILYLPHCDLYPRIGQPNANPDHKHDFAPADIVAAMRDVAAESFWGWTLVRNEVRDKEMEYSFLQIYRKEEHQFGGGICHVEDGVPSKTGKTLGVARLGAYGDAFWATSLLKYWKDQGYRITVYTQEQGEAIFRNNPNVAEIVCQPKGIFDFGDGHVGAWQSAYFLHEEKKFDRWINLIGAVEGRLLPHSSDASFYLPFEQRKRIMGRNYVEALHEWADVPFDPKAVRFEFYPTDEERDWAVREREKYPGRLVLINPSGTSVPKWYPHSQDLADRLAAHGIYSLIVGDPRFMKFRSSGDFGRFVGMDFPIRNLLALAPLADAVFGTESVLVNSVAFAKVLKVVVMSHSSHENLTRDWLNTIALEPEGLPCFPCHRIHSTMIHCAHDTKANAALCHSAVDPAQVVQIMRDHFKRVDEAERARNVA